MHLDSEHFPPRKNVTVIATKLPSQVLTGEVSKSLMDWYVFVLVKEWIGKQGVFKGVTVKMMKISLLEILKL